MYLLGYDIGSSSVKASIVEAETGRCVADDFFPKTEAPILTTRPGWAEQDPDAWWGYLKDATHSVLAKTAIKSEDIKAIGISYQMHGLVCVDKQGQVLRPAIIWCDSRAVPYGEAAFKQIGEEECLSHLLNSPGNFTAAKLAWVKENEPDIYERIYKVMLPGDYIAFRLTGEMRTTIEGLSEGILWDFRQKTVSRNLLDCFGFPDSILPDLTPTFSTQGALTQEAATELGLRKGIPLTYRAGDQPNNALSLNVFNPGEIASTAGTSGVVYGVSDQVAYDPLSRVNTFAHVNYTPSLTRIGILLCINGTGCLNAWMKRNVAPELSYEQMNELALQAPIGSKGLSVLPFGNGAERILQNKDIGCSLHGLNFNLHDRSCLLRACQEGIVFAFQYGMEIMRQMGMRIERIHAGKANMFLSPLFREALAGVSGATIELYETDGAAGAAKGAGIGAGIYKNHKEAFASLKRLSVIEPAHEAAYKEAYEQWKQVLRLPKSTQED